MKSTWTIAYLSGEDPRDKNAWSGTLYNMAASLEAKGCVLIRVGPAKPIAAWLLCSLINKLSLLLLRKRFDYRHAAFYAKAYARLFSKRLQNLQFDIVMAVGGSEYVAYLNTNKPVVLVVDRTVAGAIGYHQVLSNLLSWSQRQSVSTDARAMQKTALNFFASTWAQQAALSYYQLEERKNVMVPFGANVASLPSIEVLMHRTKETGICRLLFVGRDWKNKGGEMAVECLRVLKSKGIAAELHIVGCSIPAGIHAAGLITHGFLDRNNQQQGEQLHQLFIDSHFFILPTRFEAYGLVFAEAAAYGLPALGPDTGGVSSAMCNGQTGILMSPHASGADYAYEIEKLWNDKSHWEEAIKKARQLYDANLTWERWATQFLEATNQEIHSSNLR
ncbi:MAG: glycosyltransferase family 4 protein [Flavobacteriales bacterium]